MVGFGGGSSYIAFLAISDVPFILIPKIALICNIIVVLNSSFLYYKRKLVDWRVLLPIVASSAPMAFFGGLYKIGQGEFYFLLILSLILVAIKVLFIRPKEHSELIPLSLLRSIILGGGIGFISGIVGLGGGIFLSPILIFLGHLRSKHAAAVSCFFILINSLFGITGQIIKSDIQMQNLTEYIPLFLAVLIGGHLGARIGTSQKASFLFIQKSTGVLILLICLNLIRKFL